MKEKQLLSSLNYSFNKKQMNCFPILFYATHKMGNKDSREGTERKLSLVFRMFALVN